MHSVDSNTIVRLEEAIGTAMNAACEACSAEDAEPSFASLLALMGRHLLKDAGAQTNSEESDPISDLRRQFEDKDAEIARLRQLVCQTKPAEATPLLTLRGGGAGSSTIAESIIEKAAQKLTIEGARADEDIVLAASRADDPATQPGSDGVGPTAIAASVGASSMMESGGGATADGAFTYGWAAAKGRRPTMEDAHLLAVPMADGQAHLFGVFDGHAGRRAVERIVEWLPEELRRRGGGSGENENCAEADASRPPSAEAVRDALLAVDARLLALSAAEGGWNDGATALLAILSTRQMQLAQVGDSQAALCSAYGAEWLCPQHRIGTASEDARLEALGAVIEDGRLVGDGCAVAVTRSLGDAGMKTGSGSGLIAEPEVSNHPVSPADECLILGCDGLWDVMEAEEAWDVAARAGKGKGPTGWDYAAAASALVTSALDRKTGDNVSIVVIGLRKPRVAKPHPRSRVVAS